MSKPLSLILWIAGLVVVIFLAWHIVVSITVQQKVDEKISELSNIALISYNKCRVNSFDRSVTLSNLIITLVDTRQPFSIEKLTWKEGDLRVKNLIFDIDKAGSRADYLRQLGYHGKIPVSFSLQSAWNQNRTTLHAQLHITMQDIATLAVNGHFNRIPFFDANFLKPSLYANITVHDLSILYTDNSYLQRALKVAATKNNQSVKEWKQHILTLLDSAAKNTQDRLTINALGALGEFIKKPSPISLKIEPDNPKSLGEIFYHIRDIHYLSTVLHTQIATKQ